ncbi:MAG: ribonuclease HI family protein [Dehalococcoidia bacterium]|nr:ribonuclease HI family protein [Dehalococcoidia bacterium]
MYVVIYTDGACRGNPGPSGIGASIENENGDEIAIVSSYIGNGTNNRAEYIAAIEGVKKAIQLQAEEIELRMDSLLVVRQVEGLWKIKHPSLKILNQELKHALNSLKKWRVKHVPREKNQRADSLANMALD